MKPFPVIILILFLSAFAMSSSAAQTDIPDAPAADTNQPANNTDALRAYLELQSQIQAAQLALERSREKTASESALANQQLEAHLDLLEKSHAREMQMAQANNRIILIIACSLVGMGFLAMFFTGFLQLRSLNRMTEVLMTTRAQPQAIGGWETQRSSEESQLAVEAPSETTLNLLNVIERLEKRIMQLEQIGQPPLESDLNEVVVPEPQSTPLVDQTARITLLLGKGQSLLNLDQPEDAIQCFDEILDLDGNNTEALVKKGVALERMRKLPDAIACYDRAIAADSSMTIAYLYKGGVYNRMEKFSEALECYEQALKTQDNENNAVN